MEMQMEKSKQRPSSEVKDLSKSVRTPPDVQKQSNSASDFSKKKNSCSASYGPSVMDTTLTSPIATQWTPVNSKSENQKWTGENDPPVSYTLDDNYHEAATFSCYMLEQEKKKKALIRQQRLQWKEKEENKKVAEIVAKKLQKRLFFEAEKPKQEKAKGDQYLSLRDKVSNILCKKHPGIAKQLIKSVKRPKVLSKATEGLPCCTNGADKDQLPHKDACLDTKESDVYQEEFFFDADMVEIDDAFFDCSLDVDQRELFSDADMVEKDDLFFDCSLDVDNTASVEHVKKDTFLDALKINQPSSTIDNLNKMINDMGCTRSFLSGGGVPAENLVKPRTRIDLNKLKDLMRTIDSGVSEVKTIAQGLTKAQNEFKSLLEDLIILDDEENERATEETEKLSTTESTFEKITICDLQKESEEKHALNSISHSATNNNHEKVLSANGDAQKVVQQPATATKKSEGKKAQNSISHSTTNNNHEKVLSANGDAQKLVQQPATATKKSEEKKAQNSISHSTTNNNHEKVLSTNGDAQKLVQQPAAAKTSSQHEKDSSAVKIEHNVVSDEVEQQSDQQDNKKNKMTKSQLKMTLKTMEKLWEKKQFDELRKLCHSVIDILGPFEPESGHLHEFKNVLVDKFSMQTLRIGQTGQDSCVALQSTGDGSCMFNSICQFFDGHERRALELRILTCAYMILHQCEIEVESERQGFHVTCNTIAEDITTSLKQSGFSSAATMYAAACVTKSKIQSVYPLIKKRTFSTDFKVLNTIVNERANDAKWSLKILWTGFKLNPTHPDFKTNHFVPLVEKTVIEANESIEDDIEEDYHETQVKGNPTNNYSFDEATAAAESDSEYIDVEEEEEPCEPLRLKKRIIKDVVPHLLSNTNVVKLPPGKKGETSYVIDNSENLKLFLNKEELVHEDNCGAYLHNQNNYVYILEQNKFVLLTDVKLRSDGVYTLKGKELEEQPQEEKVLYVKRVYQKAKEKNASFQKTSTIFLKAPEGYKDLLKRALVEYKGKDPKLVPQRNAKQVSTFVTKWCTHHAEGLVNPKVRGQITVTAFGYPRACRFRQYEIKKSRPSSVYQLFSKRDFTS
jgi:hypothetical protein